MLFTFNKDSYIILASSVLGQKSNENKYFLEKNVSVLYLIPASLV